jgi:hypothetical protein
MTVVDVAAGAVVDGVDDGSVSVVEGVASPVRCEATATGS